MNHIEYICFYKRNQQQGKRVADYVAELRRLAFNCEFGNLFNEALCDHLICGMCDEPTQWIFLVRADRPDSCKSDDHNTVNEESTEGI